VLASSHTRLPSAVRGSRLALLPVPIPLALHLRELEQFLETYILLRQRTAWIIRQSGPMHTLNLSQSDITAYDDTPVRLVYDSEADMLEIFFGTNEPATGIEITEHIVLRLNLQTKRAVSLLLLNFSILTEQTEYGPRSYPLTTLHELPG
jgi:hypothetical protein